LKVTLPLAAGGLVFEHLLLIVPSFSPILLKRILAIPCGGTRWECKALAGAPKVCAEEELVIV
jgi:hypothetical protein